MSMFFLALNELGFPPANKLVDETLELLVRGFCVCALSFLWSKSKSDIHG